MQTIPYRISKIETTQFAQFSEKYINGEPVQINTSVGFNLRSDISGVRSIVRIDFLQNNNLLLILELACYYDIAPEGKEEIIKESKISVEFLRYLGTISIGTARGVLHSKTEGTVLNPIVLPPINLVEMIKDDLILAEKQLPTNSEETPNS